MLEEFVGIEALEISLPDLATRYAAAPPFPHIVLDNVLKSGVIEELYKEFADIDPAAWTNYLHVNERKYANTNPESWGTTLQAVAHALNSDRFVAFLGSLTGFEGLRADATLDGGGLHRSVAGGHLNVHADFSAHHTEPRWQRRVNVLLYLNSEWRSEWGGDLELWSTDMARCEARVAPVGNRMVVFTTAANSFHGHPEPLRCPLGVARQSMALYYFTEESALAIRSTNYRARPGDGVKGAAIYLDKQVLHSYDVIKRRLRLSDSLASRWLGLANRARHSRRPAAEAEAEDE